MLPSHGRYAYHPWPQRAEYDWPGGAKLAVYLGLNLEHFAFGEGLGAELAPGANGGGGPQPDVLNYAWRDYGNRVGAWRVLEMLDELSLPATVLLNSAMYDHAPELVAAHRARGDEIAGHGRTNSERQSTLPESDERALIAESTAAIARAEGAPPRGWLSPWVAESRVTPDLLAEAGYRYTLNWCADDQPIWMATRAGRLLAIPYPQEVNDIPAIVARKDGAAQFAEMILADFEERLRQVRDGKPQVMGIALHPYLIGQPYRLRALRQALASIAAAREDVWITTAGAIFDHVAALPEGMVP
ncbi:polysaccharide deacetylase family protein [Roseomonas marmotae]|uniref:Chitooligosaccharide deacetylase n=1 Tax=Roseomonas marmotae TaxID=2768161 RepID=A0ABS3KEZ0_9PROT|nr:polysaccharide deacetylase family protein [Roseomonas marmotae]MBO1076005.1 polysaccharide deacetylase family protein [Roseomonas marmotae]QTI80137.1 polysaccharide deacetylase family protein [Roseomonas marmotae]